MTVVAQDPAEAPDAGQPAELVRSKSVRALRRRARARGLARHELGVDLRAARVPHGLPEVEHVVLVGHRSRRVHGTVRQDAGQDEAAPTKQGVADAERVVDAESVGVERPRDLEPRALVLLVLARHGVFSKKPLSYRHLLTSS